MPPKVKRASLQVGKAHQIQRAMNVREPRLITEMQNTMGNDKIPKVKRKRKYQIT